MKVQDLLKEYYLSFEYNNLREETKAQYKYFLGIVSSTCVVDGKELGSYKLSNLTTKLAKLSYNKWCERGVSFANHLMSVIRVLLNYGINMEHCVMNPFSNIKKRVVANRKVVWTKEDIIRFLDIAYSDFKTRNIGLIAQMAYEWCQRIGDMRLLSFDSIDFDNAVLHLQQSKRRARVELPISDNLFSMLQQQREEFGFQQYVAPYYKTMGGMFIPYSLQRLSVVGKKIMQKAGLPNNLWLMDFRRTGTTEMVEAGVSMGQIMSVTGHANPSSVKPYMKNTLASADSALSARKEYLNNS